MGRGVDVEDGVEEEREEDLGDPSDAVCEHVLGNGLLVRPVGEDELCLAVCW